MSSSKQQTEPFTTSFGAVATRCQAKSKRSGAQCRKPAMRGKAVCRCAQAKTIRGWETREIRRNRAEKLKELRALEGAMLALGMIKKP